MKRRTAFCAVLLLVSISSCARDDALVRGETPLALGACHGHRPNGAVVRPEMTIVIESNRIAAMAKTGEVAIPANTRVVDASGALVIPGRRRGVSGGD